MLTWCMITWVSIMDPIVYKSWNCWVESDFYDNPFDPFDLLVTQAKAMVMLPFLPQVPWRMVKTNLLLTQHTFQIKFQKTARCELPQNLLQRLCSTQTLLMWPWSVKWQISTILRIRPTMLATAFQVKVKFRYWCNLCFELKLFMFFRPFGH